MYHQLRVFYDFRFLLVLQFFSSHVWALWTTLNASGSFPVVLPQMCIYIFASALLFAFTRSFFPTYSTQNHNLHSMPVIIVFLVYQEGN